MTDWDIKKAYQISRKPIYYPQIFIDDYWDYQIKGLGMSDDWEDFRKTFISDGFKSFEEFYNERQYIVSKARELMLNCPITEFYENIYKILSKEEFNLNELRYASLHDGEYIEVDLRHGCECVLKSLGFFNEQYSDVDEIIKTISDKKVFLRMKSIRLEIYKMIPHDIIMRYFPTILKNIVESSSPIIEWINENCEFVDYIGDAAIYKVPKCQYKDILGEHEINTYRVHIDEFSIKRINIESQEIVCVKGNRFFSAYHAINGTRLISEYFPIAIKKYNEDTITDMDTAVGYENQIYFHINKNPEL